MRHGVSHRHEAAAVVPAVADAQQGGGPVFPPKLSHMYRDGPGDAPEKDIFQQGQNISSDAGDKPPVLVSVDIGGDTGVHPGAHHVDAQLAVAVDEIEWGLRAGGQGLQVIEQRAVVRPENLQKVVPCPLGDVGNGHMAVSSRPVNHLVQGAVAAAGVDPYRLAGPGGLLGEPLGVPLPGGVGHLMGKGQLFQ